MKRIASCLLAAAIVGTGSAALAHTTEVDPITEQVTAGHHVTGQHTHTPHTTPDIVDPITE